MEPIVGGWLKKSPPDKRLWRAKWRRRWFVLKSSGQIPGQYMLEYFTDQSCRKLKGRIDLDQCEQVDVGVSLDGVLHRKSTYEHVFDIRTPKRIYYLVAEREVDMNKWVDSICSVCGLQMHAEEEVDLSALPPPQPSIVERQPSPTPSGGSVAGARATTGSLTSLTTSYSSNPYIPISECISGGSPSAINGLKNNTFNISEFKDRLNDTPPPPPLKGSTKSKKIQQDEFYDIPRPLHQPLFTEHHETGDSNSVVVPPPQVNWSTYPKADSEPTNLYENQRHDDVYDHPVVSWIDANSNTNGNGGINSNNINDNNFDSGTQPSPTSLKGLHNHQQSIQGIYSNAPSLQRLSSYENHLVSSPTADDSHFQSNSKSLQGLANHSQSSPSLRGHKSGLPTSQMGSQGPLPPPPRPPKPPPAHLFETLKKGCSNANNYDNIANVSATALYDIPPTFSSTQPDLKLTIDDLYDFPKSQHSQADILSSTPPPPLASAKTQWLWQRRRVYSNAPTSIVLDNDLIDGQEYLPMEPQQILRKDSADVYTDMSGTMLAPTYSNVPSPTQRPDVFSSMPPTPPAVNRDLKPRPPQPPTKHAKNLNEEQQQIQQPHQTGHAPAVDRLLKPKINFSNADDGIPTGITLSPAPTSSLANPPKGKRSFRKQKPRASPCPSPTVSTCSSNPNHLASNGLLFPYGGSSSRLTDRSSSDDDHSSSCSSRRNSSNDDHHFTSNTKTTQQPSHRKSPSPSTTFVCGRSGGKEPEIQYLDLDLELDVGGSGTGGGGGGGGGSGGSGNGLPAQSPKSPEKLNSMQHHNTVYKTVDFVRTKAFNDMRENVEKNYRKS
ncbi:hypothetical protein CHUAL_004148 [Chamberlinius hualienensis]